MKRRQPSVRERPATSGRTHRVVPSVSLAGPSRCRSALGSPRSRTAVSKVTESRVKASRVKANRVKENRVKGSRPVASKGKVRVRGKAKKVSRAKAKGKVRVRVKVRMASRLAMAADSRAATDATRPVVATIAAAPGEAEPRGVDGGRAARFV